MIKNYLSAIKEKLEAQKNHKKSDQEDHQRPFQERILDRPTFLHYACQKISLSSQFLLAAHFTADLVLEQ